MSTKDDKVGYRRPPKHSQFKKGRSGNPGGRPKGRRSVSSVLESALYEKVTVVENGRRIVLTKLQAAAKQLANKAASGDPKASKLVIDFVHQAQADAEANQSAPELDRKERDARHQRILAFLKVRMADAQEGGDDES